MKRIVIVNGYSKSGKTEFERLIAKHFNVIIYSTITPVKQYAKQYFGWSGDESDKTEEWRNFFSKLKRMLVVEFDYIFKDISNKVNEFHKDINVELLLIDSREPEEIGRFKNQLHAITVFVERNDCDKVMSNESDANVENFKYDYIIENNGSIEELEQKAIELIIKLKGER